MPPADVFAGSPAREKRARGIADPLERLRYLRRASEEPRPRIRFTWWWMAIPVLAMPSVVLRSDVPSHDLPLPPPPPAVSRSEARPAPEVWPVERTGAYEVYSNGLRIEDDLTVANVPRSYRVFGMGSEIRPGPLRDQPAGIVFHITESGQAPFEPGHSRALRRIGRDLLLYVRNRRAYHFVIDRFGQVHRIVAESDEANHAGHSVWADSRWLYLDLNASFLGVAFESRTEAGGPPVTDAQIHAAAVLTGMLRSKYHIAAEDCVTHAQVSVNPGNMRIGWHTDWGTGFPFAALGLPDNYAIPNPALYLFGFESDEAYRDATGPDVWKSLAAAESRMRYAAANRNMNEAAYRAFLRQRYRNLRPAVRQRTANEEN